MKIYKEIEQGTPEWFAVRKLKLTGSHATAIANQGAGLKTYVNEIILNLFVEKEYYTNSDIERGNNLETIARAKYELENNVTVEEVGFIEYTEFSGGSTDGMVGVDGLIEIKARNNKIHYGLIVLNDNVDSSTIWQIQFYLLITCRKWCDFISYNPNFRQSIFVKRIYPDIEKMAKIEAGIKKGTEMLKELLQNEKVQNELKK